MTPLVSAATDLGGFTQPTDIAAAKDGGGRLFVAERAGVIRVVRGGALLPAPALDITARVGSSAAQGGLLGLAFPPDFAKKQYAYICFTDKANNPQVFRVRTSTTNPDVFDPSTMQPILSVAQPAPANPGGQLAFGPDGYLYIGLGDGGGQDDPSNRAQDLSTLFGKILRIDTERTPESPGYKVPADNPFRHRTGARPEIWALGVRDPSRFSFDSTSGDLWIGDVGQSQWEEVDLAPAGRGGLNFGWSRYEGNDTLKATTREPGFTWPVFAYTHRLGTSVTGGYVYRGSEFPAMQGQYVFGDFSSGNIWTLRKNGNAWDERLARKTFYRISTFGVDESGELWVADYSAGRIHRLGDLTR